MTKLKNPQAFDIEGKREFAVCARLNGYCVVMETKPEHHDLFGDRVCLHISVEDDENGEAMVGVKGATHVLDNNDPGESIVIDAGTPANSALQDPHYATKIDDIVMNLIDEAGGQEEILVWLEEAGRLEPMIRAINLDEVDSIDIDQILRKIFG